MKSFMILAILTILLLNIFVEISSSMATRNYCRHPRPRACREIFSPVCAYKYNRQHPPRYTASNGCSACRDHSVEYWITGRC